MTNNRYERTDKVAIYSYSNQAVVDFINWARNLQAVLEAAAYKELIEHVKKLDIERQNLTWEEAYILSDMVYSIQKSLDKIDAKLQHVWSESRGLVSAQTQPAKQRAKEKDPVQQIIEMLGKLPKAEAVNILGKMESKVEAETTKCE